MLKIDYPLRRMLDKDEAAIYCHIPKSKFPAICPVPPTRLHDTLGLVWDIKELDKWLDNRKDAIELTDDEILEQLPA